VIHPARRIPFDDLVAGLEAAKSAGMVLSRDWHDGRRLYIYSNKCVYDDGWDEFSLLARGLVLHPRDRRIVATPFPKFFNVGERGFAFPDMPFETFEKVDGSLAIIHHFDGSWRAVTKGAFDSPQAQWAEARLRATDTTHLDRATTYLAEVVYPENRIVIRYDRPEMVLLAAYDGAGAELPIGELQHVAERTGWRVAKRYYFKTFLDLRGHAESLPREEEGFVVRFDDGLRLKLKGNEYRRIHALISRCTPLAMWEAMIAGGDMDAIRRDLPEEFWSDFDAITTGLAREVQRITAKIAATASAIAGLSDKEVGLQLATLDPEVRPFIFHWRKAGGRLEGKARETLLRTVRPTGNVLAGYTPSYAISRVMDETG
jgi:RNA ligase